MQDFIQSVVQNLGVDQGTATKATGGALQLLEQHTDGADFSALLDKLPGAGDLLKAVPALSSSGEGGGGMLGGMLGKAASALGGGGGAALGAVALLGQLGLDGDKIKPFVAMFGKFIQSKAGQDLAGRILGGIPELKSLLD